MKTTTRMKCPLFLLKSNLTIMKRLSLSREALKLNLIHIYIAVGYTDMRKQIDGLSAIVQQNFKLDPFSNSVFLFCGRNTRTMKALYWEGDGFVLLYKRLENGKFKWPRDESEALEITSQQFRWLLEGLSIVQPKTIQKSYPQVVL